VFNIRLLSHAATLCDDVSLTELTVRVSNKLPLAVSVDDVQVDLESPLFGRITYSSGKIALEPGEQTVSVFCSTSVAGLASLREASVVLGNVELVTTFPEDQVIVPIHRNLLGLRTLLHMPEACELRFSP
jgi:hypothetical protein